MKSEILFQHVFVRLPHVTVDSTNVTLITHWWQVLLTEPLTIP